MKIVKRSGSYRVQKQYKGVRYSFTFDHYPTKREIQKELDKRVSKEAVRESFKYYALKYVENRSAVLSPSSIRTYRQLIKNISDDFNNKKMCDFTSDDIQVEINLYATTHAPKTVRSLHGFISAVFATFRPSFTLHTTLPQKEIKDRYLPTQEDIKRILEAAKGSEYSIAFQLGILSCRRSEVSALTIDDLKGNSITISKNMVYNRGWEIKNTPKTDASHRIIIIPDSLKDEIIEKGYIFKYTPPKLNEMLHKYQDKLNIPRFRFHDLRVYFASYASTLIPESDAMALGGWKSDYVFKQTYRRSMEKSRKESGKKIAKSIL